MAALDRRLIVVTGGAGGIARACLPPLLGDGARLLLIDPDRAALAALADEIGERERVRTAVSALESPAACAGALAGVEGPVYGLVHLAGLFLPDTLDAAARPVWDRVIAANLTNAFDMAAAVAPRLDGRAVCRMVFASSLAYRRGSFDHVAYSAAKGGIIGLVRALSRRLAPAVLVNGVAPGIITTAMPEPILADPARRERLLAETTLKRFGAPHEVASVIHFLLGPGSTYITGQVINIDGGVINA